MQQNQAVGGHTARTDSRGSMEQDRSTTPRKFLINESSQIGDRVILQGEKNKISSPTNPQRHSPVPLGENGRNKERRTQKNFEGYLGVLNCERDHTYRIILPKLSKHSYHTKDSSEWKLSPQTFARTTQIMGKPGVELFASRLQWMTCNKNRHICSPMLFPNFL